MRALFLVPPPQYNRRGTPVDRVYGCNHGFDYKPPIHLLTVATWMRERAGWDVRFLDCPAEGMDEYERVCFRCHAVHTNRPVRSA